MIKKVISLIIFTVLTILIAVNYEDIIKNKYESYNIKQYYNEKNNIDVFFLGTSRVYFTMSPMEIWHKYGIVSYNRGTAQQYYKVSYLFLEEILSKYNPKLIIFDTAYLEDLSYKEKQTMIHLQNLKNDFFKFYAYKYIYKNTDDILKNINTIKQYHSRWKELTKYDFTYDTFWKGRFSGSSYGSWLSKIHSINSVNRYENDNITQIELYPETIKYANMMVDLVAKHNCNILFVKMPFSANLLHSQLDKAFKLYAEEKGWNFINYNIMYDELNLNFNRDFRDWSHTNLYGSRKVMDHLIPYIIKHYNIQSHKNDPKYASWNEDYIKYARAVNREEIRELKSFTEWKNLAFYDNYTVMIAANGDVLKKLPDNLKNDLKSFGLKKYNSDKANMRYAAVIDENQIFFEEISNKPVKYKGRMKNIINLFISSDGKAAINVSGKNRSKNKYGLNFVIYDKVNREIVDSIYIDPDKPDVVRR